MPTPRVHSSASTSAASPVRLQCHCPACGFQNLECDLRCQKCGRRLPAVEPAPFAQVNTAEASVQSETPTPDAPTPSPRIVRAALPDHVKSEIHSRVERFRARRRGQTLPLPFVEPVLADEPNVVPFPTLEDDPSTKARSRVPKETLPAGDATTSIEASADTPSGPPPTPTAPIFTAPVPQIEEPLRPPLESAHEQAAPTPPVDLSVQVPLFISPAEPIRPHWQAFRIATLRKRVQGITHDLGCILLGAALFAAPFYWVAGAQQFSVKLLVGFAGGTMLIALLYGLLFLGFFGETPGMAATGLRLVSFSGHPASAQQRLLRVAGAMVSSGSFLCGYLWAFVDEEQLYWHDHISKTVLADTTPDH